MIVLLRQSNLVQIKGLHSSWCILWSNTLHMERIKNKLPFGAIFPVTLFDGRACIGKLEALKDQGFWYCPCCKSVAKQSTSIQGHAFAHIFQGAFFDQLSSRMPSRCSGGKPRFMFSCPLILPTDMYQDLSTNQNTQIEEEDKCSGDFLSSQLWSGSNVQSPATMTTWEVNISDRNNFQYHDSMTHRLKCECRRRIASSWQRASWASHQGPNHSWEKWFFFRELEFSGVFLWSSLN